jgi:branched-chain amino acid transport system ATP-binding protein
MLNIDGLVVRYGGAVALDGVTLAVGTGESVAVLGSNGAGKSTLLRAVSGLVRPAAGSVTFGGQSIVGLKPYAIAATGIGHVPEGRRVFAGLTVRENLLVGAYNARGRRHIAETLGYIFDLFPVLAERSDQRAGTLSGGEQQMLAIGRGLMGKPDMLLLDEPSLGLAPTVAEEVFEHLTRISQTGTGMLIVEQNVGAALKITQRAYVLEAGLLQFDGASSALANDPRVRHAYLGGD